VRPSFRLAPPSLNFPELSAPSLGPRGRGTSPFGGLGSPSDTRCIWPGLLMRPGFILLAVLVVSLQQTIAECSYLCVLRFPREDISSVTMGASVPVGAVIGRRLGYNPIAWGT
jgi:hypothetical protein